MSVCDQAGAEVHPNDYQASGAPEPLLDMGDFATILRAVTHDHAVSSPDERWRLACIVMDLAERAGLRDAP